MLLGSSLIQFEGPCSMSFDKIEKMRADARRYREMATNASDTEVAETLVQIASDLEAAIQVIEKDRPDRISGALGRQTANSARRSVNAA
jgi:carbamoylphosphate synthase large subunit